MDAKPQVFLAGPAYFHRDDPFKWQKTIQFQRDDVEWINPFKLIEISNTELDVPEERLIEPEEGPPPRPEPIEARERRDEIIDRDLTEIRSSECVLMYRTHGQNLCGASMEVREAYVQNVPVVVWNDTDRNVPLFLEGHAEEICDSPEEAAKAAATLAKSQVARED